MNIKNEILVLRDNDNDIGKQNKQKKQQADEE